MTEQKKPVKKLNKDGSEPKKRGRKKGCPPPPHAFKKGQVTNPRGRPKRDRRLNELIVENSEKFYDILINIIVSSDEPVTLREAALDIINKRGWFAVPNAQGDDDGMEGGGEGVHLHFHDSDKRLG